MKFVETAALWLLLLTGISLAQVVHTPEEGDQVRVLLKDSKAPLTIYGEPLTNAERNAEIVGTFERFSGDTLVLAQGANERTLYFPTAKLQKMELHLGKRTRQWEMMMAGIAGGGLLAILMTNALCDEGDCVNARTGKSDKDVIMLLLGAVGVSSGATGGFFLGLNIEYEKWAPFRQLEVDLGVTSIPNNGIGLSAQLRF